MQYFSYLDKREVLQQEYSQPLIIPSPHFRWVVNVPQPLTETCCYSAMTQEAALQSAQSCALRADRIQYHS